MRFYQEQHELYCGIDLHAQKIFLCIVNQGGEIQLHKNIKTHRDRFLTMIRPFRKQDLVVGVESTFNWYWLADLCIGEEIPFVLGHALGLRAIHGGKVKNDKVDSQKLALLLRGGNFPLAYVYPKEHRATRDWAPTEGLVAPPDLLRAAAGRTGAARSQHGQPVQRAADHRPTAIPRQS